MPLVHSHTIGASGNWLRGAVAFLFVWGLGQFIGPLSPLLLLASGAMLPWWVTFVLVALLAFPYLVPEASLYSPAFCRFSLSMAGWLKGGSTLWITDEVLRAMPADESCSSGFMVCYHPHGLIPCGFTLNGAVRARAKRQEMMPHWLRFDASVSGVQAPVLFRIPILRWILLALGCCVPATKAGLSRLMRQRTTFGIIPGGSEEVALHASGREHLYLRHRAGFVKYALRHGYTLVIAFSFGESDLYRSLSLLRPLNLWLVRRCGIVLPIFYGHWCCPLLPRTDVPLNTVLGKALVLPRIDEPTEEDVARWHAAYVAALEALYEEHKEYFGYAGRQLKIY